MSGLRAHELSRRFGNRWVLVRVDLEVPAGEGLLLLGPNGSGKTTLLRCLATALKPHHGTATFEGTDLWAARHALRDRIALLSHATRLYEDLSAAQNLSCWAAMGDYRPDVPALLHRVGLDGTGSKPVRAFSAGMRRRLALALALVKQPRLVLFDEPFSALDPQGREVVGGVLDELRGQGATLVLSTHHASLGARFCTRAVRLEAGRIAWTGPAAEARDVVADA
ncbi:MAG: heme ABC exporter ATP-binding protein CcmA [Alphaproteobacteria bacterium]|nr:heme ABC exporter ATP-binding protein CcmA [Alphaproteobacteria bacterium]